jgi:hypothetical protein
MVAHLPGTVPRSDATPEATGGPSMPRGPGPDYDSFVVRLWHEAGRRLLRAEVEHVQSGAVHVGRGPDRDWIAETVNACIRAGPEVESGESEHEGNGSHDSHEGKERDDAAGAR